MGGESAQKPSSAEVKSMLHDYIVSQYGGEKKKNGIVLLALSSLGIVAAAMGLFVVLVPLTYLLGGQILYSEHGWKSFQPGVGGNRFVALNGLAWALYATNIVMTSFNFFLGDMLLSFASFGVGMMSYSLMVSSLLTYQNDKFTQVRPQVSAPDEDVMEGKTFNAELVRAKLLHSGAGPTDLWWFFIVINSLGCVVAAWIAVLTDIHAKSHILRVGATISSLWLMASATAITHALGGQWQHLDGDFVAFQPGKGGSEFVAMQAVGWMIFSIAQLLGIIVFAGQVRQLVGGKPLIPGPMLSVYGVLGMVGQFTIAASLFFFEGAPKVVGEKFVARPKSAVMEFLKKTQFFGLNIIFGGGSTYENSREPKLTGPDDWKKAEELFMKLTSEKAPKTGDQYLIIGVGFVGRRLVKRLLDRGETKIRIFDIIPSNPFAGDDRVEYIQGDVTRYDDVKKACEGVDTVYSTFAIIRFMDRLEHQAALSYRINVGGSENVLKACRECNVKRVIVTSSSHATTDEHSQPRLGRDETSPYVVKETAHNHYGWTKAAADIMCLKANGSPKADGTPLRVSIVRPCSGVFGGDDRISFEKAMDLTIFPGLGAKKIMDWVYVENVVLGHLLLEGAMQRNDPGVDGEAFNISNNEAVKGEDLWFTTMKIIDRHVHPEKQKSTLDLIYIPEAPLWFISYISELNQKIFKGRVSLGKDLDMLTPGMLATATMEYSYNSDKAERVLGYIPAYSLDEALQKSLYDYWENKYPNKLD